MKTPRPRLLALILLCLLLPARAHAAEVMPPAPARYFNDYANVVSPPVADQLNRQLEQFERDTSNQIVVAIYPKMQSDSDIADYTVRVAQAWRAGQKKKGNGAVLFVFTGDRKMSIQAGYGLEGALPDAICKQIIDQEIAPHFKTGDYDGGLTAGINAIIAATKNEYHGNGSTDDDARGARSLILTAVLIFLFIGLIAWTMFRSGRGRVYGGTSSYGGGGIFFGGFGGGGFSGGGGFGGGGGGFSGGGGGFGGGGASGSW